MAPVEAIGANATNPVFHGVNGGTLEARAVPAMLHYFGVKRLH
jgi:hypothetical protein